MVGFSMFSGLVFIQIFLHRSWEQFLKQAWLPWVARATVRINIYFAASVYRAPNAIQQKIASFPEERVFVYLLPYLIPGNLCRCFSFFRCFQTNKSFCLAFFKKRVGFGATPHKTAPSGFLKGYGDCQAFSLRENGFAAASILAVPHFLQVKKFPPS